MKAVCCLAVTVLMVSGCSSLEELWRGGPRELSRLRPDVAQLACQGGKSLAVRMEPGGKAAWMILPEREFRLDAIQASGDARYSNGRTTLIVKGDEMTLEEGGAVTLAGCRRPAAG